VNASLIRTQRAALESSRRKIERDDIVFANANKHRLGWQTIANIRGVNMLGLRKACEFGFADPEPAPPKAAVATPTAKLEGLRLLRVIQGGAASVDDLREALGYSRSHIGKIIGLLKAEGLLAGHARAASGWVVTKAGDAALWNARP
jgi:hypothetical protein